MGRFATAVATYRELAGLGFPERYPLVQFPNAPLMVAIIASLAGMLASGTTAAVLGGVATAGVVVWAWWELWGGVNLFRRALGLAVLVNFAVGLIT